MVLDVNKPTAQMSHCGCCKVSLQFLLFLWEQQQHREGKDSAYVTKHQSRPAALQLETLRDLCSYGRLQPARQGNIVTAILIRSDHHHSH